MGSIWGVLLRDVHTLLVAHPVVLIAVAIFAEELGIPTPLPGEAVMLFAGYGVAQGRYSLWLILIVEEVATVAGSFGLYLFSRGVGRPVVTRYGRYLHLGPSSLERAAAAVRRLGGWWAIVAGRVLPGFRIVTPVAAGVLDIPRRVFVSALAAGGFVYLLAFTLLGRSIGPTALRYFDRVLRVTDGILALAVLALLVVVVRRLRQADARLPLPPHVIAAVAGLSAGAAGLLAANGVLGLISGVTALLGEEPVVAAPVIRSRELANVLHLVLGWPAFLALAGLLGLLACRVYPARLSLRPAVGVACAGALVMTAILLLIDLPRIHGSLALERRAILTGVELLRVLVFGLVLSQALPLTATERDAPDAAPAQRVSESGRP